MTNFTDPQIKISDAVAVFGNNKSALARYLKVHRSLITYWVNSGNENVPILHAYRLMQHNDFKK